MRVVDIDKESSYASKILNQVWNDKIEVCLWQRANHYMDNRVQHRFHLKSITKEPNLLNFKQLTKKKLEFKEGKIFGYCEYLGFIFSADIMAIGELKISLERPQLLFMLNEDEKKMVDNNDWVSLQDVFKKSKRPEARKVKFAKVLSEEERYKHVRETPRGRPEELKMITVSRKALNIKVEKTFRLFDLSQGGVGILTAEPQFFEEGMQLYIHSIEDKDFDPPLTGEVMSVRLFDSKNREYKVGIKFDEP
jgi:hypothetical protein